MSTQNEYVYHETAQPIVAGIFNIVVGSGFILSALGLGIMGMFTAPFLSFLPFVVPAFISLMAVPMVLIGVLIIIGGIFAVQRRQWGWALAGSIASACISHIPGIISIILIGISKREFDR
jgi:hypothetical protein